MKNNELENQYNLVKSEMIKLHDMLTKKVEEMEALNTSRFQVRSVEAQLCYVNTILKNYFDFFDCNQNNEILIACKLGDNYIL